MTALRPPPAVRFAAHVAARRRARPGAVSPASRLLAIRRAHACPRPACWSLTVRPALTRLLRRVERERLVTRLLARETRVTSRTLERSRVLLERVVQRGTRVDGARSGAPAATAVAAGVRPVPVPRVIPRIPHVPAPAAPGIRAPAAGPDAKPWPRTAPVAGPIPLAPGEVDRLTDQVLGRIDHRLTAQRERHGWSR